MRYHVRLHWNGWGLLWRSENKLDGKTRTLIFKDLLPCIFRTRRMAAKYNEDEFGYIRGRRDLHMEPHGWKMPLVVRVKVEVVK
jgi:hypothetical protein